MIEFPLFEKYHPRRDSFQLPNVVADDQQCLVLPFYDVFHPVEAFFLEIEVAHGQDFVDDQDIGVYTGRDGEAQTDGHAGTVSLERRIDELLELGKRNDIVHLPADLGPRQPQDCTIYVDVLAPGEIRDKPGTDFNQRSRAAADRHVSTGRLRNVSQYFQQGALTRAIAPDDAHHLRLVEGESRYSFVTWSSSITRIRFRPGELFNDDRSMRASRSSGPATC